MYKRKLAIHRVMIVQTQTKIREIKDYNFDSFYKEIERLINKSKREFGKRIYGKIKIIKCSSEDFCEFVFGIQFKVKI